MINNTYLENDDNIYDKQFTFNNNKDKIVFSSTENNNYIYKIDTSQFPITKYDKYIIRNDYGLFYANDETLSLNFINSIYVLKDNDNILKIKHVSSFNKLFELNSKFDIEYDSIKYNIHYSSKVLIYSYSKKIKLQNFDMLIEIKNHISLKSYHWYKSIDLYVLKDDTIFGITLLDSIDDLINFIKPYNTDNFVNLMDFYACKTDNYDISDFINNLKYNIQNYIEPLRIGKKKMQNIVDGLSRYFLPIVKNDTIEVYLQNYNITYISKDSFKLKYLTEESLCNTKNELLIRKAKSKFEYINNSSKIDIYNGTLIDNDFSILYADYESMIIQRKSYGNYRCYYIKVEDMWVEANENESNTICERYNIVKLLNN